MFSTIIFLHVTLASLGYAGLIAANVGSVLSVRSGDVDVMKQAAGRALLIMRLSGALLLGGIILGFIVDKALLIPLLTPWLIWTYLLIVAGASVQLFFGLRWSLQMQRVTRRRTNKDGVNMRAPLVSLTTLLVVFVSITALMLWHP
jgi:hypothetical protein